MKLKSFKIKNFRGYKDLTEIQFDALTAFVGKNDVGKSTILEALDIFFHDGKGSKGNGTITLDKDDINKDGTASGDCDIYMSAIFSDLPQTVIIDETFETNLKDEYLLNESGDLEIVKFFKNGSNTSSNLKIYIKAQHPQNENCNNLLQTKQKDLQKIISDLGLHCTDNRKNKLMRQAIWKHYENELDLRNTEIDVSVKDSDVKAIWEKLNQYMPYYSLFQSDRNNSDKDDEVQDPLQAAVRQIMSVQEIQNQLNDVFVKVKEKLQAVSDLTLSKLQEMNPNLATSLHPKLPTSQDLKWSDVFNKVLSITGDNDIPINKRGSGVKRLILLNFFRAEVERRKKEGQNTGIIYAIEEPETSQHQEHQIMMMAALKSLSENSQIIITTHSDHIVKQLEFENIRLILDEKGTKTIEKIEPNKLPIPSLSEINYLAFRDFSTEYHNELYGYIQSLAVDEDPKNEKEKDFENWLISKGCKQNKQWAREKGGVAQPQQPCTLHTYIRNFIHHPENKYNIKYTDKELLQSIKEMRNLI